MPYLSPTNRRAHDLPTSPTPEQLAAVRAEHIARIEAAADRAARRCSPRGIPPKLVEVGIYLARHGFHDDPCEGELWFGVDFYSYRDLGGIGRAERFPETAALLRRAA